MMTVWCSRCNRPAEVRVNERYIGPSSGWAPATMRVVECHGYCWADLSIRPEPEGYEQLVARQAERALARTP